MALEPILIFAALLSVFLAYKSRQIQKEHKAANEHAETTLKNLMEQAQAECDTWDGTTEPSHEQKASLKAGLSAAYEYGSGLKGSASKPDAKLTREIIKDYLDGLAKAQEPLLWPLYQRALHCALLLGQQASQPKMAKRIGEQEAQVRAALKLGLAPNQRLTEEQK